jgi:CHAT domain-containing protein
VLGLRLSPAVRAVGLLCFLHFCLQCADTSSIIVLSSRDRKAVFAEGDKLHDANKFADALRFYVRAAELARDAHDPKLQARSQFEAGACLLHLFRYRAAVTALQSARDIGVRINDLDTAGGADLNVTTVYLQLGEYFVAQKTAREAVRLLENSPRKNAFAMALMNYAWVEAEQGRLDLSKNLYYKAIEFSQTNDLPSLEASAWNHLGQSLLDKECLPEARHAVTEAYRLYLMQHNEAELAVVRANLALLDYKEGKYKDALIKLNAALASPTLAMASIPPYFPLHLHGQVLAALHRDTEALKYFQQAVTAADDWRLNALPGDVFSTHTLAYLHAVYQDFVCFAAQLSLERHDPTLAARALAVLSRNRAASLREQLASAYAREDRLPPGYFDLLNQLKLAEARAVLGKDAAASSRATQIRMELSELESNAGLNLNNIPLTAEKISDQKSLRDIQLRLSKREALLSFCLGKEKSYLWAVTREKVTLYDLPRQEELAKLASQFSTDIRQNHGSGLAATTLSRELFGKLDASIWDRPEWILVGDGPLLNGMPFAALPYPRAATANRVPALDQAQMFLAANHSIRLLPTSQFLLSTAQSSPNSIFVGIGDPIYNLADPRRAGSRFRLARAGAAGSTLARLAGSEREVKSSARLSGLPSTSILTGPEASSDKLRLAFAKNPEIVHFAVHVVSPEGHPEEAALALSLNSQNIPELLPPEIVASFRLPGSLVVLSGCASQQGQTVPSVGLVGLSRAWLLAGASAVIVSAWPTPDDSGHFFSSFYSHLQANAARDDSLPKRAAAALQDAQADMRRDGGYRSLPSFWAAYSIIAKE